MRESPFLILIAVSFVWSWADACAQQSLQVGGKFGLVAANHWSPHEVPENTTVYPGSERGITGGVALGYAPSRNLDFIFELIFFEKGAHHTVTTPEFPYGEMHLTYRCNYIDLPFTLRTYWFGRGGIRFYTHGGGYCGYLVSNIYRFYNEEKGYAERELKDTRRFDLGFVSGLGFDIQVRHVILNVEYRYTMGLLDIPLSTDPVHIPAFRGIDFPTIELRNLCHLITFGAFFSVRSGAAR